MSISFIKLLILLGWLWSGFWSVAKLCSKGRTEPSFTFFGALAVAVLLPPVYLFYCWLDRKFQTEVEMIRSKVKELLVSSPLEVIPDGSMAHYLRQLDAAKLFEAMFETAVRVQATGIFFESDTSKNVAIRFVTKKKSVNYSNFSGPAAEKFISFLKIIASAQTTGSKNKVLLQLRQKNLRWNILLAAVEGGQFPKAMLRIEPKCSDPLSSDDLKISGPEHYRLNAALQQSSGLILICGAPDSGRESILYALIRDLDGKKRKNAVLLAPSEKEEHPAISVLTIKRAAGISADILVPRAVDQRREAIFLEEFPTIEPIQQAIHAALTGHLVVAVVPGNNTGEALTTLVEQGISPQEIKDSLLMTISTGIMRKLCSCKQQSQPNAAQHERFRRYGIHAGSFFAPRGCDDCNSSGYYSEVRICCTEVENEQLKEALEREEYTPGSVRAYFARMNMTDLEKAACCLAASGVTSPEEASRFIPQNR